MKRYYANVVINGLCFDVQRMVREKYPPKTILDLIKKKTSFLENKQKYKWPYKVVWWESTVKVKENGETIEDKIKDDVEDDVFMDEDEIMED